MPRDVFRYLTELAYIACRRGWPGFKLNTTELFCDFKTREGFDFADNVEHLCWVSGCTYHFYFDNAGRRWLHVSLPRSVGWLL